jgi:putative flippase GtrA
MSVDDRIKQWVPDRFEPLLSAAQFGQFISVGVVGAVADTAVLALASLLFGVSDLWAKAAGVEVAILIMFFLNEQWTFPDKGDLGYRPFLSRLWRSHLVRSGGVGVQLAIFWALVGPYSIQFSVAGADIWFVVASLISIGIATVINYVFESLFTWQVQTFESSTGEPSD